MKKVCVLLWMILLLSACVANDKNLSSDTIETEDFSSTTETMVSSLKFNILGEYICSSKYFSEEYFSINYKSIPSITFYDDNTCVLLINYLEGCSNVEGIYSIEDNEIHVKLDLQWTLFEGTDNGGFPYMDDEYIFTVIDEDNLQIDRGYYTVEAGTTFTRTSAEPGTKEPKPEYDILGKYVCSSDYYNDPEYYITHSEHVPYIKFLKEGHCILFVDKEGGRKIWGQYRIEEDKIYVSELRFRYLEMVDEVRDSMEHEYVFTIIDNNHLVIDRGFYNVEAGDDFIRNP